MFAGDPGTPPPLEASDTAEPSIQSSVEVQTEKVEQLKVQREKVEQLKAFNESQKNQEEQRIRDEINQRSRQSKEDLETQRRTQLEQEQEQEQERGFLQIKQNLDAIKKIFEMQPTDLAKLGQREIKSIGNDITNIPLDTFKKLSEAQTVALKPEQIRAITAKPEYLKALKTEYISPVTMYEVVRTNTDLSPGVKTELLQRTSADQANYMLNQPNIDLSPGDRSILEKRESHFNTLSRKIPTNTVQGIQRAREALGSARDTIKTIPSKLSENINKALTNTPNWTPDQAQNFLKNYLTITGQPKYIQTALQSIKPNVLLSAIRIIKGLPTGKAILNNVSAEQADYILNNDPELSAAYKEVLEARESYLNKFGRKAREKFGTTSKAVARSAQTVKEKLNATKKQFSATAKKAVDAINDSLNKNRDYQEARRLIKKDSTSELSTEEQQTTEEQQALEMHITKLTTKEKERILNELTQENDIKIKNIATEKTKLLTKLSAMDTEKGLDFSEQSQLENQISALNTQATILDTHSELIRQTIERSLTPNEVLMPLVVNGVKYPTYDIVDMSQINPADPDFAKALDKVASVHFLPNGREGRMDATTLANNYYTWIADKITPEISTNSTPSEILDKIKSSSETIQDNQPINDVILLKIVNRALSNLIKNDPAYKTLSTMRQNIVSKIREQQRTSIKP